MTIAASFLPSTRDHYDESVKIAAGAIHLIIVQTKKVMEKKMCPFFSSH